MSCHQHTFINILLPLCHQQKGEVSQSSVCDIGSTHCMKNIISSFIIMQFCQKIQQVLIHAQNIQAIKFQICKFYSIQDSTYASFEIATFRFSLDYKLAIFTIYKFRNIQASKNFESKCKITFLCRLMIIASYCNVQVASLAS